METDEEYEEAGCLPDLWDDEEDNEFCNPSSAPFTPDDEDETEETE